MNVLLKTTRGVGFELGQKPVPQINDDQVLIKIKSASLCGTDMHIYHWDQWSQNRINPPLTVGHELSGVIVEVGKNISTHKIGDIVACETHVVDNSCEMCLSGNAHVCENTQIIGVDIDGAFAEYIAMPASNCRIQTTNINPKFLSVLEPLGNAVHTVSQFDVKDKCVAIVGCGPIGLMGVNVAKALGAKLVIAVEINKYRQNLAKELGADIVLNPLECDIVEKILSLTNEYGVDVSCDFSGNEQAISAIFKYTKQSGCVSMLGIPSKPLTIDFGNDIIFKGLTIYGVVGRKMYQTWDKVEELLATGKIYLDKVVTHEFKLEEFEQAITLMDSGNCGKIIFNIGD